MTIRVYKKENVITDGTEQEMLNTIDVGIFSGYIDLSEMHAGDTIKIGQYLKIGKTFLKYAEETYSDAQSIPAIYITPKENSYGLKITVEQTIGDSRRLPNYFLIDEEVAEGFRI